MSEQRESLQQAGLMPMRRRAARITALIKESGSRIREAALRLLPGVPGAPPTVQRANRAAAGRLGRLIRLHGDQWGLEPY